MPKLHQPPAGPPRCHYCDRPAEFLCDYPVAFPDPEPTCDRPLCADHRRVQAAGHLCVRGGKHRGCSTFSIDYCPQCHAKDEATGRRAAAAGAYKPAEAQPPGGREPTSNAMVAITGNTYPVRDKLKALGGRWDAARRVWCVPADKAEEARQVVAEAPKEKRCGGVKARSHYYPGGQLVCETCRCKINYGRFCGKCEYS